MKKLFYLAVLACLPLFFTGCETRVIDTDVRIYGTVYDAETYNPIQGATLTLMPSGRSRYSGSDGAYQFDELEMGSQYTVTAVAPGYRADKKTVMLDANESSEVSFALKRE